MFSLLKTYYNPLKKSNLTYLVSSAMVSEKCNQFCNDLLKHFFGEYISINDKKKTEHVLPILGHVCKLLLFQLLNETMFGFHFQIAVSGVEWMTVKRFTAIYNTLERGRYIYASVYTYFCICIYYSTECGHVHRQMCGTEGGEGGCTCAGFGPCT